MRQAFLTLSDLKVPRLVIRFRDLKKKGCSNIPENSSKFVYLGEFRKKKRFLLTLMSHLYALDQNASKIHNSANVN